MCASWSSCIDSLKSRNCKSNCDTTRIETRTCGCEEKWSCSWGECIGGRNSFTCSDLNDCKTSENKPEEYSASCSIDIILDFVLKILFWIQPALQIMNMENGVDVNIPAKLVMCLDDMFSLIDLMRGNATIKTNLYCF